MGGGVGGAWRRCRFAGGEVASQAVVGGWVGGVSGHGKEKQASGVLRNADLLITSGAAGVWLIVPAALPCPPPLQARANRDGTNGVKAATTWATFSGGGGCVACVSLQ